MENPALSAPTSKEEKGTLALSSGQAAADVLFIYTKTTKDYAFEDLYVENTIDANPLFIGCVPSARSKAGFTVSFAGEPDTANYVLKWHVKI